MLAITRFILWKHKISILVWSLSLSIINILIALVYDTFSQEADAVNELYQGFSELEAFFPIEDIVTPAGFLNVEMYSLVYPIIIIILAVGIGSRLIGKDEQSGALEFLLSQPVSRANVYIQKALAIEVKLLIISFIVFFSYWVSTHIVPAFDVSVRALASVNIGLFIFGLVFGMFSFMLTGIGLGKRVAMNSSIALATISYLLNIIPEFVEDLRWLEHISLFHYFDTTMLLKEGYQWGSYTIMIVIACVFFAVGMARFLKRDIAV